MRVYLQLVADANDSPDDRESAQLAIAREEFNKIKGRLSETMAQICPDDNAWAGTDLE